MDWTAIWLSVRLAAATTLVLLAIGVPLAYWIVFSPKNKAAVAEATRQALAEMKPRLWLERVMGGKQQ